MKIIIAGIGKLGAYLTRSLVEDKHEITIIDDSFKHAQELINNVDINYILGNALDFNILKEAGIENADLFIAVMDKDEKNVISCMLSKKLGVKNTIARIREPEYSGAVNLLQYDLGLSLVINPLIILAVIINEKEKIEEKEKTKVSDIKIATLESTPNNIGRIFNLNNLTVAMYLDKLQNMGYIKVVRTAGLDIIKINEELTFIEVVEKYYNSII